MKMRVGPLNVRISDEPQWAPTERISFLAPAQGRGFPCQCRRAIHVTAACVVHPSLAFLDFLCLCGQRYHTAVRRPDLDEPPFIVRCVG